MPETPWRDIPNQPSADVRYCVNCRHAARPTVTGSEMDWRCYRPLGTISLVTGEPHTLGDACAAERSGHNGDNACGPVGRWFEPRPTADNLVPRTDAENQALMRVQRVAAMRALADDAERTSLNESPVDRYVRDAPRRERPIFRHARPAQTFDDSEPEDQ
jgi:hypothetical protein